MRVLFIYRSKKLGQYSIERCFNIIKKSFSENVQIDELYLPEERARMSSILKNIKYVHSYLKTHRYDIVHITGDAHYVAIGIKDTYSVLTIHDLRGISNYRGFKRSIYELLWVKIPCAIVDKVVPISEATRQEIIKTYPICNEKIETIPDPIDDIFKYVGKDFNKNLPRILMIGTGYNKNVERVIKALATMQCCLDIVGPLTEKHKKLLSEYNISYINDFKVSDDVIYEKYCLADIVMFPSTYEGFGMIIIEGQSVGRPVITSNIEPMISVAGDAAYIVDPYSVEEIKQALIKLIDDDKLREKIVNAGKVNARKYSGNNIANAYEKLYCKLLNNRKV